MRLLGTNAEEVKKLIDESGLKRQSAILLSEAANFVANAIGFLFIKMFQFHFKGNALNEI
ncbi:MAG: hypothetical protein ACO1NX_04280 [Chitinophagaceae bacterium]